MLYSRYETQEIKEKGKVIGHKRVRKDDKKITSDEKPSKSLKGGDQGSNLNVNLLEMSKNELIEYAKKEKIKMPKAKKEKSRNEILKHLKAE